MKNATLVRFLETAPEACPKHWRAPLACCPRCGAAYESVLHAFCEYELQEREMAEGKRDRITCTLPSIQLRNISARNGALESRELGSR